MRTSLSLNMLEVAVSLSRQTYLDDFFFNVFAVCREHIDLAQPAFAFCTYIVCVLKCPAAALPAFESLAFTLFFVRTAHYTPAGDESVNMTNSMDTDFFFLDCFPNANEPFNIRLRIQTLLPGGLI